MTRSIALTVLTLAVMVRPAAAQDEPTATSKIVSVGLFKNSLAVVKREILITKPGTYRLDATPDAVHGTFWVESNANVEVALRMREVEVDTNEMPRGNMQEIFAGKKVTIHFTGNKMPPVSGTVPKLKESTEQFLVLKTGKGNMYIKPAEIAAVETEDDGKKATQRKPVLVLTVAKGEKKLVVYVSYLSHGLAWAPSYRVDISDPKSLQMEMTAVVRNEMGDFKDAEVSLISGFPSVEFANVSSPLSAQTAWSQFFRELASRGSGRHDDVLTQNPLISNRIGDLPTPRLSLAATPEGEGVDLHFESIGKHNMLVGEALSLQVGKGKADYERIVEWTVGGGFRDRGRGDKSADEVWDVLHFKNPFKFPLTTAPAMVVEKGKFNGQRTCYWTNVGEETNLRITKSLSLRTLCLEEEDKAKQQERVAVGTRYYTRIHVKGELVVNNHRKEAVKMQILYSVRGEVADAAGKPRIVPREGTLTELNPTRDVIWLLTLQPGEERKLAYGYSTLVDR